MHIKKYIYICLSVIYILLHNSRTYKTGTSEDRHEQGKRTDADMSSLQINDNSILTRLSVPSVCVDPVAQTVEDYQYLCLSNQLCIPSKFNSLPISAFTRLMDHCYCSQYPRQVLQYRGLHNTEDHVVYLSAVLNFQKFGIVYEHATVKTRLQ